MSESYEPRAVSREDLTPPPEAGVEQQAYEIHSHGELQHAHYIDARDTARAVAGLEVAHDHRALRTPVVHS